MCVKGPSRSAQVRLKPVDPAHRSTPQVDTSGLGTYAVDVEGAAVVAGTAKGAPFNGTLPDPGVCEAATEVFTGRYDVVVSSERRLRGDDGWYECG